MSIKIKNEISIDGFVVAKEIVDTETGVCYLISYKSEAYDGSVTCIPMVDSKGNTKVDKEFGKEERVKENWVDIGEDKRNTQSNNSKDGWMASYAR